MLSILQTLRDEALERLDAVEGEGELDRWRAGYLGRSGALTALLREIGSLPAEQRPAVGKEANALKAQLQVAMEARRAAIRPVQRAKQVDVTLPGRRPTNGRLHPVTATLRRMPFVGPTSSGKSITSPCSISHRIIQRVKATIRSLRPIRSFCSGPTLRQPRSG